MAIGCKETITSLDINFSNGGGGHTASITSVRNAKDLASSNQENLGSLIGVGGGKTTFSNDEIKNLLRNFTEVERTISQNATTTTISRKYEDTTSLILKAHGIVVRGRDSHPTDSGSSGSFNPYAKSRGNNFSVSVGDNTILADCNSREKSPVNLPINPTRLGFSRRAGVTGSNNTIKIPYFGEVIGSPLNNSFRFPYKPPLRSGSLIFVGNIYNEESSISYSGEKVSLVYQSGNLQENLSFNDEEVGAFYKQFPDFANYNLKYGYTLSEARSAFNKAGITIEGLPSSDAILLTESGTLDSVLSSIASKFGYYWYVDPFAYGRVVMVNSLNASQIRVTNPLTQSGSLKSKYVSGSFSTNYKRPKIVDLYASTIERQENTNEMPDADRFTRLHKWNPSKFIETLDFNEKILEAFYIFYASDKFISSNLFTLYALIATAELGLDWGDVWPDHKKVPTEDKWKTYDQIFSAEGTAAHSKKAKIPFDLTKATFIPLFGSNKKKYQDIYNSDAFEKLKLYFDCISSSFYISHKYGRWKATRMAFKNSPLNIEGPFNLSETSIGDTDGFSNFATALKRLNRDPEDIKLSAFWEDQDKVVTSNGDFAFLAFSPNRNKDTKDLTPEDLPWGKFDEKAFHPHKVGEGVQAAAGMPYLAFSDDCRKNLGKLYTASKELWEDVTKDSDSMRATYNRSKRPVSIEETEEDKEEQEKKAKKQAELDEEQQKVDELRERFDERQYKIQTNGASGSPLTPIQINVSNLSISDVASMQQSGYSSAISNQGILSSSSRTIVGLSLPTSFSLTISGLSIKLGSSGITTTINESSVKILKPDEQVILANSQASTSRDLSASFSAGQKNFMGL